MCSPGPTLAVVNSVTCSVQDDRTIAPKKNAVSCLLLLVHAIGTQSLHLRCPQHATLSSGSAPSAGRAVGESLRLMVGPSALRPEKQA